MSVFVLKCNNCAHKFYDIVVLCTNEKMEEQCPICNSNNLQIFEMPKPQDKKWAEDNGCKHKNPNTGCSTCTMNCKSQEKDFIMPKSCLQLLKKPWGPVLKNIPILDKNEIIITVGDISTGIFLDQNITPNLAIIDHQVQRQRFEKSKNINKNLFDYNFQIKNPKSKISQQLYKTIEKIDFVKNSLIEIDGEEDLATLVCLLHAPLNSNIFYGQVNEGLVHIKLDKKTKHKAEDVFNKFEIEE